MSTTSPNAFFNVRGTMPSASPSYVKRVADDQLYEALSRGDYCFVLTSRQVGKSSLMARAAVTMRAQKNGTAVVVLDVTSQGENVTVQQWYGGLLDQIGEQLNLEDELEAYWRANTDVGVLPRWIGAISRVALPALGTRPLVIFIDEVDFTRTLPFKTDEFFAGIRECYTRRIVSPEMSRLTFCLIGSARPFDLIRDVRTTPFNIGQRIDLTDFTLEEALPLAAGMHSDPARGRLLLERVLYWTGGHPYLTQRLCQAVAIDSAGQGLGPKRQVDAMCQQLFFSIRGRDNDDNLVFVRDRILKTEEDRAQVLELYSKILDGKRINSEDNNPVVGVIRLAGIARQVDQHLAIRNRIYDRVFDDKWVQANMPDQEKRRQRAAYRRGLLRLAVPASVIVAVVSALAGYAWHAKVGADIAKERAERSQKEVAMAAARVRQVLETAYKSNLDFLHATEFTGMSRATHELVVKAALDQLGSLQSDPSIKRDNDIQIKVAGVYDAVGRVQRKLLDLRIGQPADARESFQAALDIRHELDVAGRLDDEQRKLLASNLHNLGVVNYWPGQADETLWVKAKRVQSAATDFRTALKIRSDQFAQHPNESKYAVELARTLIAMGDFLHKCKPQVTSDDLCPSDCYQKAEKTLKGPFLPPAKDEDPEAVQAVYASALEHLGTFYADDAATFSDAHQYLVAAANEASDRWSHTSDKNKVNASLEAAKKELELARYECRALDRPAAWGALEKAATCLGVGLGISGVDEFRGTSLKEVVPADIDVRACLADAYALASALDASDGVESHDSNAALAMCANATEERLFIHELNPESGDAVDALARAYLQQGYAAYRATGARSAIAAFDRVRDAYLETSAARVSPLDAGIAMKSQLAEALVATAIAQQDMGKYTDARRNLENAISSYPTASDADPVTLRARARTLYTMAGNWSAQRECDTAVRNYGQAIEIQKVLAAEDPAAARADLPDAIEKRLELSLSLAGRAECLGRMGRKEDARADIDAVAQELKLVTDPEAKLKDAGVLEMLMRAHVQLAKAWKSIEEWGQAAGSLANAADLAGRPERDHSSSVSGDLETEVTVLRAEVNYRQWNALLEQKQTPDADWRSKIDQQKQYMRLYTSGHRDPDNLQVLGAYTAIIRFVGLYESKQHATADGLVENEAAGTSDQLLKNALKFRGFMANRFPLDVSMAETILESYEDFRKAFPHEIEHARVETITVIKELYDKYPADSAPKLSAQIALATLYRQCPEKNKDRNVALQHADEIIQAGDQCAANIQKDYPDAAQRWRDFRAAPGAQ